MGDGLFLALLYVRLSISPLVRHAFMPALYILNPWWDLQNNPAQTSTMVSQCAVHMFGQGRFKVKVIVQGKHCMTVLRVCCITLEGLVIF